MTEKITIKITEEELETIKEALWFSLSFYVYTV